MTKNQTETGEVEIDLLELARVLWSRIGILILCAVLLGAAAFGGTYFFITPKYTATALMYVNNSDISVGGTSFSISASELTAAQSLVDTYGVILKSRMTLGDVIDTAGLSYSYDELYDMIESKPVNSTEIFEVNVTSTKPSEAEYIANTIAALLPDKIANIVDGSDVRIVDYAVIPSERTSPSYTKNTVIGALVGAVLAAVGVIIQYILDENIRTEDYLTQTYPNVPLLAVIPYMGPNAGKEKGGYYGGYYRKAPPDGRPGPEEQARKTAAAEKARKTAAEPARKTIAAEKTREAAAVEQERKAAAAEKARKAAAVEQERKAAAAEKARKTTAAEKAREAAAEQERKAPAAKKSEAPAEEKKAPARRTASTAKKKAEREEEENDG